MKELTPIEALQYLNKGKMIKQVDNGTCYIITTREGKIWYKVEGHFNEYLYRSLSLDSKYYMYQEPHDFAWACRLLADQNVVTRLGSKVRIWQETMSGHIVGNSIENRQQKWCPTMDDLLAKDWVEYIP